jgi:serine/threonine-protein kinase
MIGQTLGHYHIVGKLGEGGMGQVYRARDTKLGRDVALKVLPDAFGRDPERMTRFEREARVLASLNHPNIAAIYGLEEDALVMELVEGEILRGPLALEKAIGYARQMAEALEYAHEKGIVHRDLKPANIKVTRDSVVKILDFGLAKIISEDAASESASALTVGDTRPGSIMGTTAYMAPEQARGEAVDKRADIWAYGVVLYEILTGKPPFAGKSAPDILSAVLSLQPDMDAVPAQMRRLIRRCLEKDPKRRWRDIGDVRLALEEKPELATVPKRNVILPWVVAGVLATALAAALLTLWRMTRPVSRPLVRLNVDVGPEAELNLEYGVSAILSPDGSRLVYTGRGADSILRLYTRTLDQGQATALPGTEGAGSPFFAPDGSSVGFFAGGRLKKVSVREGGGSVVLCEAGGDARAEAGATTVTS